MRSTLLIFSCLFVFSCKETNREASLIVGQWIFSDVDVSGLDSTLAGVENIHALPMRKSMQGLNYQFFTDSTFAFNVPSANNPQAAKANGTWSLSSDRKIITMKKNGTDRAKTMNITLLNQDSMVLEEQNVKLIFLRKK